MKVVIEFYLVVSVITILSSVFAYVYMIGGGRGGPGTSTMVVELYIFNALIRTSLPGIASAVSVLLFLVSLLLIVPLFLVRRRANEEALDGLLAGETAHYTVDDLVARLRAAGVPAAPVNRLDHVLADPWYRVEYFSEVAGPEGCLFTVHGEPIRPAGRKQLVTRSPMLGEHTDDVLASLLGLTRAEIDELYAAGVLG